MDTYEKKYKEALERARIWKDKGGMPKYKQGILDDIFPELKENKESEDERIRKDIIWCLKHSGVKESNPINPHVTTIAKDAIAWLEKQGEQNPFDYENANIKQKDFAPKVELKFKKGDWIISNNKQSTYQVIEVKRGIYVIRDNADNHEYHIGIEECEKSGRLFTIQDAKDGDVLYSPCLELLWIFKNRDSVYCGCNLSYNNGAFCGEGYFEMPTDAIPATKEQHDTLMKAMTDAGWEFDFDKKELKKISQRMVSAEAKEAMYDKPTDEEMKELLRTEYEKGRADAIAEMQKGWSEEDERNLRLTEYAVMKFFGGDCSLVGWLRKSLKDRYTWKPNKEQMKALDIAIRCGIQLGTWEETSLKDLFNDLKKLKEE